MFYKILGWLSIIISTLLLAPSFVPGTMSILASYIALFTLIASIFTVKSGNAFYFKTIAIITAINIFIINDGLRLYGSLPQFTWQNKLSIYGIFLTVCVLAAVYAKKRVVAVKSQ